MKSTLNLQDADGFYEQLLDAHADLSAAESELLNARLILLLATQGGAARVLQECIAAAKARETAPAGPK
jgi:alkylation response protein AidB-like acyl-CoA dehydrogenase